MGGGGKSECGGWRKGVYLLRGYATSFTVQPDVLFVLPHDKHINQFLINLLRVCSYTSSAYEKKYMYVFLCSYICVQMYVRVRSRYLRMYFCQSINKARVVLVYHCLGISERPLSTQSYSTSGSSVPLCFLLQRLSLIHPHRKGFVSLSFFILVLVPRVLMVCWNFWVANTVTG